MFLLSLSPVTLYTNKLEFKLLPSEHATIKYSSSPLLTNVAPFAEEFVANVWFSSNEPSSLKSNILIVETPGNGFQVPTASWVLPSFVCLVVTNDASQSHLRFSS